MTKNSIKSYFLIIIASVILTLASLLPIGIFGIVISALLASTIGYTVTKHHYTFVGILCACVFFVYTAFSKNFYTSIAVSLPIILSGITLGISYNLKISEFIPTGVICGIYTTYLLLSVKLSGQNIQSIFASVFSDSAKAYNDMIFASQSTQISQAEIDAMVSEAVSVMMKFMPGFVIILCGALALLMLYMFKKVLKITKSNTSYIRPFYMWHADKSLSIVFFIITAVIFFLPERNYFSDALANVALVSVFVFYIFGLSLVDFLLKRKFKAKFSRRLVLFLLVTFSSGLPIIILCFMGALDGISNMREKIINKNNLPEQE